MHNNKPLIILAIGIGVIAICFATAYSIYKSQNENAAHANKSNQAETDKGSINSGADSNKADSVEFLVSISAVIVNVDTGSMQMEVIDANTDDVMKLSYTGASDIRSSYDKVISARQLEKGQTALITYDSSTCEIKALKVSEGFFEYAGISGISVNESSRLVSILNTTYMYTDALIVITGEEGAKIGDLLSTDVFTVRGIGNKICSITVTRGHGYLTLSNDDYFIGGNLYAGGYTTVQIEEDMVLTLPEGSYDFIAEYGGYEGRKTLKVIRNQTTEFNLASYGPEAVKNGRVTFNISPAEAALYIDGELVYFYETFELAYGIHDVEVSLGGYNSYKGTINIDKTENVYNVTLYQSYASNVKGDDSSFEGADENDKSDTGNTEDNGNNGGSSDNTETSGSGSDNAGTSGSGSDDTGTSGGSSDNTGTSGDSGSGTGNNDATSESSIKTDRSHTITITCTEGTEVYFNNEYVGIIEGGSVVIPKYIGTFEVDLYLSGYEMQSFTISVQDDNENVEYSFPEF